MRELKRDLTLLLPVAAFFLAGGLAAGSTHTVLGTTVSNPEMPVAGASGKQKPQADGSVTVLVFFRPDQEYSKSTLKELVPCEKQTAGKPVRWVGVVSSRQPADAAQALVKETGLSMPVLVDVDDALYVEVGVAQLPAVAITDKARKLAAYQPFTKLNFCDLVGARVRRALGEIGDAELAAVVDPTSQPIKGEASVAHRHVKMAELLLKNGEAARAVDSAREAVKAGPGIAAAHSVLGAALAASGDCKGAVPEFDEALKVDPKDARALDGKKGCAGKAN